MTKTRTGLVHNAKGEGFEEVSSKKIKPKVAPRAPSRAGTNSVSKSKDKDKKMDTPGKKKDEKEEVTITISTEDCLHCNQNVDEDEKALECDSCKKWAHLGCTEVRASQYSFFDANDVSGLKWICSKLMQNITTYATFQKHVRQRSCLRVFREKKPRVTGTWTPRMKSIPHKDFLKHQTMRFFL